MFLKQIPVRLTEGQEYTVILPFGILVDAAGNGNLAQEAGSFQLPFDSI